MTPKENRKIIKNLKYYCLYLLVIWSLYRFFFHFPEEAEELFVKPVIWISPLIYLLAKEKKGLSSIGFKLKGSFSALYYSIALGAGFAMEGLVINFFKYQGIKFTANIGELNFFASFLLSLATAFIEEAVFRGYIFNRLWLVSRNELMSNLVSSFLWTIVHLPIALLWWKLGLLQILLYLLLIFIFGVGSAFVFARSKNIGSSILLHVFWEWPIMLFR